MNDAGAQQRPPAACTEGAPRPMDVTFLGSVTDRPGPFATVCADVTHITENADTELDLRVRAIADRLTDQGAPEPVVEAVRGRLLEGNEGGEAGAHPGPAGIPRPPSTGPFRARRPSPPR